VPSILRKLVSRESITTGTIEPSEFARTEVTSDRDRHASEDKA